jgi:chemotaxis protein CheX
MDLKEKSGKLEVELPGSLDLVAAGELRDLLLDALARDTGADVSLMGEAVERMSTAAIQVVLAAASGFAAAARRMELDRPSDALAASFRHLGLAEDFDNLTVS